MKIRRKLLVAFSIYLLLSLIPAVFSYRELSNVRKRLKPIEIAGDITNAFMEVRKNERNFLFLKDTDSLQLLRKQVSILKGSIDDIEHEIIKEIGPENYDVLRKAIASYEASVQQLADNFKAQQTATSRLSDSGREIEKQLSDRDLQNFLVIRRHEKNLAISRDAATLDLFQQAQAMLQSSGIPALKQYASAAADLYRLSQEEKTLDEAIRKKADEIKVFTDTILQEEREDIDNLIVMSMNLLLLSLVFILVVGGAINARLASSIVGPIKQLRRFTERVAGGDYSQPLEVSGSHEIASLADALNKMAGRLKETVSSLELAIRNLHEKQGQLVEAEKLASLGRIAAGVAHEINNPLAIINEKAGLMQDLLQLSPDFPNRDGIAAQIGGITDSVNRCRSITHRLLGFARRMEITIEPIDLNEAVRETIGFLKSDILAKSVHMELCLADALPEIRSDKIQLEQVFLNLIKNAVDAVAEGGEITITTSQKDETFTQIQISDNGPGIPKDKLPHIFEPFFTTKERGKGTGLGLFVTHAILTRLGCRIQVQTESGKGTTFVIEVPNRPSFSPVTQG